MFENGMRKLMLLNVGTYDYAEIPLDRSLSLHTDNNRGKTTLLNAISYILIADQSLLSFDGYTTEESRKFYFRSAHSYIAMEIQVPAGLYVIFVCRDSLNDNLKYFAYKGKLDVHDFMDDGKPVTVQNIAAHLAGKGMIAASLKPKELTSLFAGGTNKFSAQYPITIFPLNQQSQKQNFQTVQRKLLQLSDISSHEIKQYLMAIIHRQTVDDKLDMQRLWTEAFKDVDVQIRELKAVKSNKDATEKACIEYQKLRKLRAKVSMVGQGIDAALRNFFSWHQSEINRLEAEKQRYKTKSGESLKQFDNIGTRISKLEHEQSTLIEKQRKLTELATEFQLIASESQMIADREQKLANYTALLQLDKRQARPISEIESDLSKTRKNIKKTNRRLESIGHSLLDALYEELPKDEAEQLSKIASTELLALSTKHDVKISDPTQFSNFLSGEISSTGIFQKDEFNLPGAKINLSSLPVQKPSDDPIDLQAVLEEYEKNVLELNGEFEAAQENADITERQINALKALKEAEEACGRYSDYQALLSTEAEDKENAKKILSDITDLLNDKNHHTQLISTYNDKSSDISQELSRLDDQNHKLDDLKNKRINLTPQQLNTEYADDLEPIVVSPENLVEIFDHYNSDCQSIRSSYTQICFHLNSLQEQGLHRFDHVNPLEERLERLIELTNNLDNEERILNKSVEAALATVGSGLKTLSDDLEAFTRELNTFNRRINKRKISDLERFKVEVIENTAIVPQIRTVLEQVNQVEAGETLDLLTDRSENHKMLEKAKNTLFQHYTQAGGIRLADLFSLCYVVKKTGEQEHRVTDINKAGSTGTKATIQLILGMNLLYQMYGDTKATYRSMLVLDEAARLDDKNQKSLINIAESYGFSLAMASVEAQATCHYSIPIGKTVNDRCIITPDSWDVIKPKKTEMIEGTAA